MGLAANASAQTAPAAAGAAPPPGAAAGTTAPVEPQGGYTYDPAGRRDPFVTLMRRGTDAGRNDPGTRPPGVAGLAVGEVTLKGTMQARSGYVALVQGPDTKTYIVKPGDKLFDGTIRSITAAGMVMLQEVNDPLSLEKQREVRKVLRQTDEVK
jgi:Tfp pilus assembly protein PilP